MIFEADDYFDDDDDYSEYEITQQVFAETERASFDEVLEFCNDVRNAGGANPLDALLPSLPADKHSCLIARNLNFSCSVYPIDDEQNLEGWLMDIGDEEVVDLIVDSLSSKWNIEKYNMYKFLIPKEIAKVAYEFDLWNTSPGEADEVFLPFIESDYRKEQLGLEGIPTE